MGIKYWGCVCMKKMKRVIVAATVMASLVTTTPVMAFKWSNSTSAEKQSTNAFDNWKSVCKDTVSKMDASDENTADCALFIKNNYNDVKNFSVWPDASNPPESLVYFAIGISYFGEKFDSSTIAGQISQIGWNALSCLYDGDMDGFSQNMVDLKAKYEETGDIIYEISYNEGQYKVGIDIPAGEYVLLSDYESAYFSVSSDANGDDIIINDNFVYNSVITIDDGQYIELKRCYAVHTDDVAPLDKTKASMFRVGKDIPSGEYALVPDSEDGYYCIYNDSHQVDIISNNNFTGNTYVNVSDGQYLVLSRCSIKE